MPFLLGSPSAGATTLIEQTEAAACRRDDPRSRTSGTTGCGTSSRPARSASWSTPARGAVVVQACSLSVSSLRVDDSRPLQPSVRSPWFWLIVLLITVSVNLVVVLVRDRQDRQDSEVLGNA